MMGDSDLKRKIDEAIAERTEEESKAWAEFREGIDCNASNGDCWCPICDPQSCGGIGPNFGPLLVDASYVCPNCNVEMGQISISVYKDKSHCPRCHKELK